MEGEELKGRDTTRRIREGLVLIPEDRQREGLVQSMSIADNLTMASLGQFVRAGFHIDLARERQAIGDAIRALRSRRSTRISKSPRCQAEISRRS